MAAAETGVRRSSSSSTPCSVTRCTRHPTKSSRRTPSSDRDGEERALGPRAGEIAAELALHFELGGDESRASTTFSGQVTSARRRSAFREARRHYEHALELLARQPDDATRAARELDLQIGLGAATMATAGFGAPPVEAAYSRARELSQQIGDTPGRFPALFGLWLFYWGRGEVRTAPASRRDLRRQAGKDPDLRLQAAHSSWSTAFSRGAFEETRRHCRIATALYERDRHAGMAAMYGGHDPAVCGGMFAGRASAIIGLPDDAARLGDEAVTLARSLEHPFSLGLALTFRAASAQALGDREAATLYAEEATAIARDQGFRLMLGWCMAISGWVAVRDGEADQGGALVDEAIATTRATGSEQFLSYLMASRAEAYLAAGRPARGAPGCRCWPCCGRSDCRGVLRGGAPPSPGRGAAGARTGPPPPRRRCGRPSTLPSGRERASLRCARRFDLCT